MENHYYSRENSLFQWQCSSSQTRRFWPIPMSFSHRPRFYRIQMVVDWSSSIFFLGFNCKGGWCPISYDLYIYTHIYMYGILTLHFILLVGEKLQKTIVLANKHRGFNCKWSPSESISSDDCQLVILHSHGIHGPFISIYNLQLMNSRQFIQIILNIRSWCFPWFWKIVNHSWFSRISYGVDLSRATLLALDPCWRGTIRSHQPVRRTKSVSQRWLSPLGPWENWMPQNLCRKTWEKWFMVIISHNGNANMIGCLNL